MKRAIAEIIDGKAIATFENVAPELMAFHCFRIKMATNKWILM